MPLSVPCAQPSAANPIRLRLMPLPASQQQRPGNPASFTYPVAFPWQHSSHWAWRLLPNPVTSCKYDMCSGGTLPLAARSAPSCGPSWTAVLQHQQLLTGENLPAECIGSSISSKFPHQLQPAWLTAADWDHWPTEGIRLNSSSKFPHQQQQAFTSAAACLAQQTLKGQNSLQPAASARIMASARQLLGSGHYTEKRTAFLK